MCWIFIIRNTSMLMSANCLCMLFFFASILLAKVLTRLKRVQNRFFNTRILTQNKTPTPSLLTHLFKIKHILSLKSTYADLKFISSIINGSLDAPEILSYMKLLVSSYSFKNHNLFIFLLIQLRMVIIIRCTGCYGFLNNVPSILI